MFDAKKLLNDLLNSPVPGSNDNATVRDKASQVGQLAKDNPLATGALAAVLLGTGAGRSITGSALKIGGVAAVAGLAYKAYQNYQNGQKPEATSDEQVVLAPPKDSDFATESAPQGADEFTLSLVKAMIAAARADGHIDDEERGRIADKLSMGGYDEDAQSFIRAELSKPVDLDMIVASAKTEAQRIELYTASRLAIDPTSRAERGYLDMLAGRLSLPDQLVDHIEATIKQATA
ncbi:tellurite resistance TerB family protein [Ahrensia kielensis]|uniref:Tellurite resistance TerB family protein n=1 Tax=Ahrensia kielensis TaxID=76980 RepID=A0ABU9TBA4_9HYPH|nr:tellurite resistance TerB family protein [Ahrensia kielensis]